MSNISRANQYFVGHHHFRNSYTYTNNLCSYLAIFLTSIAAISSSNAYASKSSADIAEQYHIVTSAWQLSNSGKEGNQLTVKHNGKEYVWKVDRTLLASRLDPNADSNSADALTRDYLSKLAQLPPKSETIIELVNSEKGAPLVVAGIGLYDSDKQWQHATQFGSRTLNLSAEKVKALGSAEKYHKKVLQFCDQEWDKIKTR